MKKSKIFSMVGFADGCALREGCFAKVALCAKTGGLN